MLRKRNTIWSYEAPDFLRKRVLFSLPGGEKIEYIEAVKESVTTRQAAEYYGVQVGRNGMACCPFHDDKHPSMKIDHRFHCFGCQADGDVIDFTARLFSLSSKEAALKLAEDFSVHYDAKGHDPPRRRPVKRKSARNCVTGRRSRNVSGCCAITCICWNAGRRNTPRRRRMKRGIRCSWRPCKRNRTRNICWIFSCPAAWRNVLPWSLSMEKR